MRGLLARRTAGEPKIARPRSEPCRPRPAVLGSVHVRCGSPTYASCVSRTDTRVCVCVCGCLARHGAQVLQHQTLVMEVIQQLRSMFTPDLKLIKKRIEVRDTRSRDYHTCFFLVNPHDCTHRGARCLHNHVLTRLRVVNSLKAVDVGLSWCENGLEWKWMQAGSQGGRPGASLWPPARYHGLLVSRRQPRPK